MAFEHKPGSGTIFIIPEAERKSNGPFAKGQVKTPSGELCDVALWYVTDRETGKPKQDKNANKMFSVKLTPKQPKQTESTEPAW